MEAAVGRRVAIVVDASVLVVMASGDRRRNTAADHLRRWLDAGEELHALTSPAEGGVGLSGRKAPDS